MARSLHDRNGCRPAHRILQVLGLGPELCIVLADESEHRYVDFAQRFVEWLLRSRASVPKCGRHTCRAIRETFSAELHCRSQPSEHGQREPTVNERSRIAIEVVGETTVAHATFGAIIGVAHPGRRTDHDEAPQ